MSSLINRFRKLKRTQLQVIGVLILILLSAFLLWFGNANSSQATNALIAKVYFDGEYRIGDGEWQPIEKGKHISSTQGDVTLRGNFHLLTPDDEYVGVFDGGVPLAFYANHINITIYETGAEPFLSGHEDPLYGDAACGERWIAYAITAGNTDPVEILIHNPHLYGNENAIDDMLSGVAIWADLEFEKGILSSGETQRYVGIMLMIVSLIFLGTAMFSTMIHIKNSRIIWLLGILVLFAGLYFAYGAPGVSFWSDSVVSNTTLLGFSMMFYMLFLLMSIVSFLNRSKGIGKLVVVVLALFNAAFFVLPIVSDVFFYDTWLWWVIVQLVANLVMAGCLVRELCSAKGKERWGYMVAFMPLIAFGIDALGTWLGWMQGGVVSKYVFIFLFVIAVVLVLRYIPYNINAAAKAKELEMERIALNAQLAESRISTMMSQIRPHFIYNTLGSIEQLCMLDPPKAGELVHNFAKYLRGNFGELDNPKPILMSREMEHVRYYVSIENVRFPDMTFRFEMNSADFSIPALTIQPIVENAIKHGLMRLQKGGTICVTSYETDTAYCVSVVDDGVGFDTNALVDARKHVGLRNIRERLSVMVNGTLDIESTPGVGTKVLITIPKEVRQ